MILESEKWLSKKETISCKLSTLDAAAREPVSEARRKQPVLADTLQKVIGRFGSPKRVECFHECFQIHLRYVGKYFRILLGDMLEQANEIDDQVVHTRFFVLNMVREPFANRDAKSRGTDRAKKCNLSPS